MAAKPTPMVMPTKYLPSRVNDSRRGGRIQRRHDLPQRASATSSLPAARSQLLRRRGAMGLRGNGDALEQLVHDALGLFARAAERLARRAAREDEAVRERGDRGLLEVVGDGVVTTGDERARLGGAIPALKPARADAEREERRLASGGDDALAV